MWPKRLEEKCRPRKLFELCKIDPWFLNNIDDIVKLEGKIRSTKLEKINRPMMRQIKEYGFSDKYLASVLGTNRDAGQKTQK